jgi:hypothetical protein
MVMLKTKIPVPLLEFEPFIHSVVCKMKGENERNEITVQESNN